MEIAPVKYTDKTLVDAEELPDGYVHLLKNKRKDGKGEVIVARKLNEYGKKNQHLSHLVEYLYYASTYWFCFL